MLHITHCESNSCPSEKRDRDVAAPAAAIAPALRSETIRPVARRGLALLLVGLLCPVAILAAPYTYNDPHDGLQTGEIYQIAFPTDAGVINVATTSVTISVPGYTGPWTVVRNDSTAATVTKNTAAINKILSEYNAVREFDPDPITLIDADHDNFMTWTIFFPAGTYYVNNTLIPMSDKLSPGEPMSQCGVRFLGAGTKDTIIKFPDNIFPSLSGDPVYVIQTGNSPYHQLEQGVLEPGMPNTGFGNYIQNLTIDIGKDNAGAGGARFDVCNGGAMTHVRIISQPSSNGQGKGVYGLRFEGGGPAFGKYINVDGFDHGIAFTASPNNRLTFEHVRLSNQLIAGVLNEGMNIQFRGLHYTTTTGVPALVLASERATTMVLDAYFNKTTTGSGSAAIQVQVPAGSQPPFLYVRDVEKRRFTNFIVAAGLVKTPPNTTIIAEWFSHDAPYMTYMGAQPASFKSLRLPIKDGGEYYDANVANWRSVTFHGAVPDDDFDDTAAIQAAVNSGKPVVYFPRGKYIINGTVTVPPNGIRKIDFMFSQLRKTGSTQVGRIEVSGGTLTSPIFLENAAIRGSASLAVEMVHKSFGQVVIRNIARGEIIGNDAAAAGGELFVENIGPSADIKVGDPLAGAWIRSIDRGQVPIKNTGTDLWLLGDHVEAPKNSDYSLSTTLGGNTELLGAGYDALSGAHPAGGTGSQKTLIFYDNISKVSVTYAGAMNYKNGVMGSWETHIKADAIVKVTGKDQDPILVSQPQECIYAPASTQGLQVGKTCVVPLFSN